MFIIDYAPSVSDDLAELRASERKRILDAIERQLKYQPAKESRHKKIIFGLKPPWDHEEPIWQLRVGEHRIFYDVNEKSARVTVRAIRRKPPHRMTKEIL